MKKFLESLRLRSLFAGAGIGFASSYIATLGMSAKGLAAHLGIDATKAAQVCKDAQDKLVWCDPGAEITAGGIKQSDGGILLFGKSDEPESDRKALGDNAIMRFENIMTTKATDRDGDDLDPKGASVDPKAPLLWQHFPDAPIGKLYKVTEQNGDYVKTACGIADTALGHDSAVLVEFGALRISHGFKPTEFEPKGNKADGEDGWNIRKYNVMEISLVSIPANTGAIITAFEKNKLATPLVKGYAQQLNAVRTKSVVSGWTKETGGGMPAGVTVNIHNHPAAADAAKAGKPPKAKDTVSDGDATTDPPKDDEGDDAPAKDAPAMFREVMDAVKAIAKDKSLPPEAAARAGLVLSMLKEASVKIAEYMKQVSDSGKNMDIAGVMEAAASMAAECHGLLSRASDEMGRVGEVAGISDSAMKSIGETRDSVATIVAALDGLVGAASDPDAAASADDDQPPIDPVDGDEDTDGNPDDAAESADDDADAEAEEENDADTDYNADVTGDSTSGADAPADTSDEDDDADTDLEGRSEDDAEEKGDDENEEKDGEVNNGDANPGVDDEPNPGMTDADKAAAKSLAALFGEPGVVYDKATLDMLRELSAEVA